MVQIEGYLKDKDMPNYAILVHALKSDCKYIRLFTLADIAYNHELKSKDNDYDYVKEHYNELLKNYNNYKTIINKYIGDYLN